MKDRPILFSAPMVKALLDGRKIVTRRICRTQPEPWKSHHLEGGCHKGDWTPAPCDDGTWDLVSTFAASEVPGFGRCPYGAPGDRLWVRETWRRSVNAHAAEACGGAMGTSFDGPEFEYLASTKWPRFGGKWKPSIHMPRRASRLSLDVVAVRVERLHEITDEDVFAEGLDMNEAGTFYVDEGEDGLAEFAEPRDAFAFLWDGINGRRAAWESNPFVWRVEFRRVEAQA